jgi:hypothetical protein
MGSTRRRPAGRKRGMDTFLDLGEHQTYSYNTSLEQVSLGSRPMMSTTTIITVVEHSQSFWWWIVDFVLGRRIGKFSNLRK